MQHDLHAMLASAQPHRLKLEAAITDTTSAYVQSFATRHRLTVEDVNDIGASMPSWSAWLFFLQEDHDDTNANPDTRAFRAHTATVLIRELFARQARATDLSVLADAYMRRHPSVVVHEQDQATLKETLVDDRVRYLLMKHAQEPLLLHGRYSDPGGAAAAASNPLSLPDRAYMTSRHASEASVRATRAQLGDQWPAFLTSEFDKDADRYLTLTSDEETTHSDEAVIKARSTLAASDSGVTLDALERVFAKRTGIERHRLAAAKTQFGREWATMLVRDDLRERRKIKGRATHPEMNDRQRILDASGI